MPLPTPTDSVHLRAAGMSLVVDLPVEGPPVVLPWGADLGLLDPAALRDLAVGAAPRRPPGRGARPDAGRTWPPGPIRLPGLDPDADYRSTPVGPGGGAEPISGRSRPARQPGGLVQSGRVLGAVGVLPPALLPDHAALLPLGRA